MDTHTILWIILAVVTIAITLMLTLWTREEPTIERKPEDGDTIEIIEAKDGKGSNAYKGYKGVVDDGAILHHYGGSILVLVGKRPIIYRLQSDGKLYKW